MMPSIPSEKGRSRLAIVLRQGGDFVTIDDAAAALGIGRAEAAKMLARWQAQGWLRRVSSGLYAAVPLTSGQGDQVIEDPWTLVPKLFDPGYVGGASAAQHWDLTEQLFRSIFVFTTRPVRRSQQKIQDTPFVVHHIAADKIFGTRSLWRGRAKIQVSDPARTIIDMMDDPRSGGGIRHVADCLKAYLARTDADPDLLINYATRLGNGAVFKRLGFLTESIGGPPALIEACAARLTQGPTKLDPALASPRFARHWQLRLPARWKSGPGPHD
jgi:predicted transcriptional regulator of viral defense system